MKAISLFVITSLLALSALFYVGKSYAHRGLIDEPILMIGASLSQGKTPCVLGQTNVLGCISVNFGEYISLGQALTRNPLTSGKIVNEAIGGAGTFDRPGFIIPTEEQAEIGWEEEGYEKQLERAILATRNVITGEITAKYVIIDAPNDCLHSNAFSTAPSASTQCDTTDLNAVVSRMIAIGQDALNEGLIPVYTGYPPLAQPGDINGTDLQLAQSIIGFLFVLSDMGYEQLAENLKSRVINELPQAIFADAWRDYEHLGDGLHPTPMTSKKAAWRIVGAILKADH